jgi:hypothetical protein
MNYLLDINVLLAAIRQTHSAHGKVDARFQHRSAQLIG